MASSENMGLLTNDQEAQSTSTEDPVVHRANGVLVCRAKVAAAALCVLGVCVGAVVSQSRATSTPSISPEDVAAFASSPKCKWPACSLQKKYNQRLATCSSNWAHKVWQDGLTFNALRDGPWGDYPNACQENAGCVGKVDSLLCYAPPGSKLVTETDAYMDKFWIWKCISGYEGAGCSPVKPSCFPGSSIAQTSDGGTIRMDKLRVGDVVQVATSSGKVKHEPILDFLHIVNGINSTGIVKVNFDNGSISASAEHLLSVLKHGATRRAWAPIWNVQAGDYLVDGAGQWKRVQGSQEVDVAKGALFAPITASGTLVVDGVVASNYAGVLGASVPHGAMHAAFFLLRTYRKVKPVPGIDLARLSGEHMNPLAAFLLSKAGSRIIPLPA